MNLEKDNKRVPILVFITFFLMIITNALANVIPINGIGTGDVSDSFFNLFAPAGITFAIWGLIYSLLFIFSVYQFTNRNKMDVLVKPVMNRVRIIFSISSLANFVWIFAWHYKVIWLSLLLMLCILTCLILINLILRKVNFSKKDYYLIKIPFTIYFGWITVATIANVTTFLVAIGWSGFGISEVLWASIIILVGAVIGILATNYFNGNYYGAVIIWAYIGILIKHVSESGFNGEYSSVIIVTTISLVFIILSEINIIRKKIFKK